MKIRKRRSRVNSVMDRHRQLTAAVVVVMVVVERCRRKKFVENKMKDRRDPPVLTAVNLTR